MATTNVGGARSDSDASIDMLIKAHERVTPLQAFKAITLDSAYVYGEERSKGSKGSIEVGKLADLVILSDNPLTVDPMEIKEINVVETIKKGKTIYKNRPHRTRQRFHQ